METAARPQIDKRQLPAAAALAALGVVYADIGTSALYGFNQAAEAGGKGLARSHDGHSLGHSVVATADRRLQIRDPHHAR
jgi:K+ transporter